MKKFCPCLKTKKVKTFTATIWVGIKNRDRNRHYDYGVARKVCRDYCDRGWCVSFTKTEFIYKQGREYGVVIGIINYPRFPESHKKLKQKTMELARLLQDALHQYKVCVVFKDETIMMSKEMGI